MNKKDKGLGEEAIEENASETSVENRARAKRFYKETWFIVTAVILAAVLIFAVLITVSMSVNGMTLGELFGLEKKKLDYLNDRLDKYIEIEESDYKNYDIEINIKKPTEELELQNKIMQLLADSKGKMLHDGSYQTKSPMGIGDYAYIYYRGYEVDEDGISHELPTATNFTDTSSKAIEIGGGSGMFPAGFELALVGATPTGSFKAAKGGNVKAGDIVYATVSYVLENGLVHYEENVRIDLNDPNVEEQWGEGILDYLSTEQIGLINSEVKILYTKDTDKQITYTEAKVNYVTRCESDAAITVKTVYPQNYYTDEALSGKTVYYDIYVEKFLDYESPDFSDFDDEFVTETLKYTAEELSSYEGETLADKCKSYFMAELLSDYEDEYMLLAEEAMWERFNNIIKVKEYPEDEFERIYNDYIYSYKLGYIEANEAGEGYSDLDEYISVSLGLEAEADWTGTLMATVYRDIKEKLIFYSIIRAEDLVPKGDEFDAVYRHELECDFEYAYGKTAADYNTAEEYEAALEVYEEEVLDYYGEAFYLDSVYYNYASGKMLDLANIINIAES